MIGTYHNNTFYSRSTNSDNDPMQAISGWVPESSPVCGFAQDSGFLHTLMYARFMGFPGMGEASVGGGDGLSGKYSCEGG